MTEDLTGLLSVIEETVEAECEAGDVEALAHLFEYLDLLKSRIGHLHTETMGRLAEVMPKTLEIEGLPVMERRKGTDRKAWQSEDLLSRLVRDAIDPEHTGELPPPSEVLQAVTSVVLDTMPVTPSMGWRVTALRNRGIDVDEWCESKPGRVTVQIHRAS